MASQEISKTQVFDPVVAENYRGTFAPHVPALTYGDPLPAGWEGLYFPFSSPVEGLRPDGTPKDGVLPPIELPRRMYAGEDTVFHRSIRIGETVEQRVGLGKVTEKEGKSGRLIFADIERQYYVSDKLAIESVWHDVFLSDGVPTGAARLPEQGGGPVTKFKLDSRHLFRFSAITFNTHRVHYDQHWAQQVEGLEERLVHGPLTRLLMLDAVLAPRERAQGEENWPNTYSFNAIAPLFVNREITVRVTEAEASSEVVALNDQGYLAAKAAVEW